MRISQIFFPKTDILIFSVVDTQMLGLSEAESSLFASGTTSDWNVSFVCQSSVLIFGVNMKCISQLTLKVQSQETCSFLLMWEEDHCACASWVSCHGTSYTLVQVYTSLKRCLQFLIAGGLSKYWIKFIYHEFTIEL